MLGKTLLLVVGVPLAATGLALGTADYAIVDVREGGPDGRRIVVPVPISLAQVALGFAPDKVRRVEAPDVAEYVPLAREVLEELRQVSDVDLVRVEQRAESVLVRKTDDLLEVHVSGRQGGEVEVSIPIEALQEMLDSYDGRSFDTSALLDALRGAQGDLVHVNDGDQQVRIHIW